MVPSLSQEVIALLDHTVLSILIALQFLGCLAGVAILILFSRYTGAGFNPTPTVLFLVLGIATVVLLQKNQKTEFWRRLPALGWNGLLLGYAFFGQGFKWVKSAPEGFGFVVAFSALAIIYLGLSAAIGSSVTRASQNPEQKNP